MTPRILDFLYDTLDLSCDLKDEDESLEFLVLDFIDENADNPAPGKGKPATVTPIRKKPVKTAEAG